MNSQEIHNKITDIWCKVLNKKNFTPDESFSSLGGRTKQADELFKKMEEIFGEELKISTTIAYDYPTVIEQTAYLHQLITEKDEVASGLAKHKQEKENIPVVPFEPIAIIGMACRLPGKIVDTTGFWELLKNGVDAIEEVPSSRWDINAYYSPDRRTPGKMSTRFGGFIQDIDQFDASFFHISPKEAEYLDPNQRIALETSYAALEDAGIPSNKLKGTMTGVYIGCMFHDYEVLLEREDLSHEDLKYLNSGTSQAIIAGRISYTFGLRGPALNIDTACSSSLVAIHEACSALRKGECNLAITGGINLMLLPEVSISFSNANMLSPDGRCRSFSEDGNGYGRSEGCGIVILKRLSDALKDNDQIHAIIKGSAVNNDGYSSGLTVPNRLAQEEVLSDALAAAQLKPSEIDYFEAHGTGTPLGDPIEMGAITHIYADKRPIPLYIGSVKSNIGHLEAASGVTALMKVILALKNEMIPKNLHFLRLNSRIRLDDAKIKIVSEHTLWKKSKEHIRRAVVSNFGFAGTNTHMVVEEAPDHEKAPRNDIQEEYLLLISAATENALSKLIAKYITFLKNTQEHIDDICYSTQLCRNHYKHRFAVSGKSLNELIMCLEKKQSSQLDLAKKYLAAEEIAWSEISQINFKKISLPLYEFEHKRFWASCLEKKKAVVQPETSSTPDFEINQELVQLSELIHKNDNLTLDQLLDIVRMQVLVTLGFDKSETDNKSYDTTAFLDLGMDSLAAAVLSRRLQYLFPKIEFSITLIFEYPSIHNLTQYIHDLL